MSEAFLLTRVIEVTSTNKSVTRIAKELCEELPATIEISYAVRMKYGKVGVLTVTNLNTGKSLKLQPHHVKASIDKLTFEDFKNG